MTLDGAIVHCEEVVKEKNYEYQECIAVHDIESATECGECGKQHEQLAEWLKELKQLREQTRWIPVSERLPNHDEYVKNDGRFNVSDGNRSYSAWFDIYDTQRFGEPTMYGFRVDRCVTAWMPLPKLYEPQESEDE